MPMFITGLIILLKPTISTKKYNKPVPNNVVIPYDVYNLTIVNAVVVFLVKVNFLFQKNEFNTPKTKAITLASK